MRTLLTFTIYGLISVALSAQDFESTDISGDWKLTRETPRGEKEMEISIKQKESIAIVWSKDGEFIITINEGKVSWIQNMTTPMGQMVSNYRGSINSKNQMKGTFSMADGPMSGRQMVWSAQKMKSNPIEETSKARILRRKRRTSSN